jgi:hypothetical protein
MIVLQHGGDLPGTLQSRPAKHQAVRHHRGITVATVNKGAYHRETYSECVANQPRPGRSAPPPAACKAADDVSKDGKAGHDQTGDDEPDGEPLPHHIGHLPINNIGDEGAREVSRGKRRQQAVEWSSAISPDRPEIVVPYQRRFRDRRVLLHVSNPHNHRRFLPTVQYWVCFARASSKFGFSFAALARDPERQRDSNCENLFRSAGDGDRAANVCSSLRDAR